MTDAEPSFPPLVNKICGQNYPWDKSFCFHEKKYSKIIHLLIDVAGTYNIKILKRKTYLQFVDFMYNQ